MRWKIKTGSQSWQMTWLSWLFKLHYDITFPLNSCCSQMPYYWMWSAQLLCILNKILWRVSHWTRWSPHVWGQLFSSFNTSLWKCLFSIKIICLSMTPKVCGIFTPLNMLLRIVLEQTSNSLLHIFVQVMVFPFPAAVIRPLQILKGYWYLVSMTGSRFCSSFAAPQKDMMTVYLSVFSVAAGTDD